MAETKRIRGRRWMAIRASWLRDNPLCVVCNQQGRITAATQLDHIIPLMDGGTDDPSNYQSLCHEHHTDKTNADMGYRIRKTIGLDGWKT